MIIADEGQRLRNVRTLTWHSIHKFYLAFYSQDEGEVFLGYYLDAKFKSTLGYHRADEFDVATEGMTVRKDEGAKAWDAENPQYEGLQTLDEEAD